MISHLGTEDSALAQLVVRDLDESVKAGLKRRARRHGRSMEDEIRHILRDAAREAARPVNRLGSRIASRFSAVGLATDLPELTGQAAGSADFGS